MLEARSWVVVADAVAMAESGEPEGFFDEVELFYEWLGSVMTLRSGVEKRVRANEDGDLGERWLFKVEARDGA